MGDKAFIGSYMSHFNHAASNWDSEGKVKLMGHLSEKTLEKLNLPKTKIDILDFGCGTGLYGLEFFEHANSLLGIDTSEGMLQVFDEKTKDHPHISSQLLNLEKEDLDGTFDLVVSSMTFHHLDHPDKTILKLSRLLNPKGQLAIVDLEKEDGSFHPDPEGMGVKHFGFSPEQLSSWAKEAGMTVESTTINNVEKNEKTYNQFLAVFKKS
jgi:ubiquinone/menaquinone biosynthesis C-methylase UbiE